VGFQGSPPSDTYGSQRGRDLDEDLAFGRPVLDSEAQALVEGGLLTRRSTLDHLHR
jgi:hypothetical protein